MVLFAAYGGHTTSNPKYIAAVKRQQQAVLDRKQAIANAQDEREREESQKEARRNAAMENILAKYRVVDCGVNGGRTLAIDHIKEICRRRGYSHQVILGISRNRDVVQVRDECIATVYQKFPRKSLPELGRIFNRDHTSIIASLRRSGAYVAPAIRAATDDYSR